MGTKIHQVMKMEEMKMYVKSRAGLMWHIVDDRATGKSGPITTLCKCRRLMPRGSEVRKRPPIGEDICVDCRVRRQNGYGLNNQVKNQRRVNRGR